jgi:hypothetical protein
MSPIQWIKTAIKRLIEQKTKPTMNKKIQRKTILHFESYVKSIILLKTTGNNELSGMKN